MRSSILSVTAAMFVAAVVVTGTPTAAAHPTLMATAPAAGTTARGVPSRVSATFSEDLAPSFGALAVVGSDGSVWTSDGVRTSGPELSVGLRADTPPGAYTVNYRVISSEGHVVTGSWHFDIGS